MLCRIFINFGMSFNKAYPSSNLLVRQ
uniref:Uncharacterized protein n=1 Tax=Rhizophora mucronata TaxID=61149 RepID=A0A2P2P7T7_RHIMU